MYSGLLESPIGPIRIEADDNFLLGVDLLPKVCDESHYSNALVMEAKQQLEQYFAGERRRFTIPLKIEGRIFQKKVFSAMQSIDYGEWLSYSEIAVRIGHPRAFRAVGSACGMNRLPIFIPCHRIVAVNGLGGFSSGISKKIFLLQLEGSLTKCK